MKYVLGRGLEKLAAVSNPAMIERIH